LEQFPLLDLLLAVSLENGNLLGAGADSHLRAVLVPGEARETRVEAVDLDVVLGLFHEVLCVLDH